MSESRFFKRVSLTAWFDTDQISLRSDATSIASQGITGFLLRDTKGPSDSDNINLDGILEIKSFPFFVEVITGLTLKKYSIFTASFSSAIGPENQ